MKYISEDKYGHKILSLQLHSSSPGTFYSRLIRFFPYFERQTFNFFSSDNSSFFYYIHCKRCIVAYYKNICYISLLYSNIMVKKYFLNHIKYICRDISTFVSIIVIFSSLL